MLTRKRKTGGGTDVVNMEIQASHEVANTKRHRNLEHKPNMNWEDVDPVTVETSVCDEMGGNLVRQVQINLLSHCVFCLRKTSTVSQSSVPPPPLVLNREDVNSQELLEDVPRASFLSSSSSHLLVTFNRIWAYLGKGKQGVEELNADPLLHLLHKPNSRATFLDLPRMCVPCAANLQTVHRLFTELRAQLDGIERIIKDSKYSGKYSWRAEHFQRFLTASTVEQDVITATLDILDKLGKNGDAMLINEHEELQKAPNSAPESATSFQDYPSASAIPEKASILRTFLQMPQVKPQPCQPSNSFLYPVESTTQLGPTSSSRAASTVPEDAKFLPGPTSSSYVEVASADDGFSGNFVDEDEDWNGNESDPDYIKSEPEDEDDFNDDEESSSEDDDFAEEWSPRQTRRKSKTPDSARKKKRGNGGPVSGRRPHRKWNGGKRKHLQESGQLLVEKDPDTGRELFHCRIDGCAKTYKSWGTFGEHEMEKHREGPKRHQCDQCDKSFLLRNYLTKHKRVVHLQKWAKGRPVHCDVCGKQISAKNIREHVREHVGDEYMVSCPNPTCKYVYTKPLSLYRHLTSTSKSCCEAISENVEEILETARNIKCQECGLLTKNQSLLRAHLLRKHENDTKNFTCPIDGCLQQFTARQSVQFHITFNHTKMARDVDPLTAQKCAQCDSLVTSEKMETHLKEEHGVRAEALLKCSHCPFVFPSREQLIEHLYEHRSSVMSCDICGDQVKFTKHARLREHYFISHKIGKRFECEQCDSVCYTQNKWNMHLRLHEKEKMSNGDIVISVPGKQTKHIKAYKCDVSDCDEAYNTASDLKDHKIKEHGAEPYSCKICTATLLTRRDLLKHEKEHGAIKFTCEVEGCGKSFNQNCLLKKHMSTAHRGERPHVCELCGKSYAQASCLRHHKDAVHLGLRSYVCDTCGESFTSGTTLRRHKLIHTGERPFSCDICGQRFRHKEVLKTHVEGHRKKGADFKPNGPMKQVRKRVEKKGSTSM